ncbi:MAG: DHH family phosphoesterase [Bacteroidales bacterium]|nr:DHH family phosphoesterase [Bacteroidales bacterium]
MNGIRPDSIQRLSRLMDDATRVSAVAHTHPDGDAVGSTAGILAYLAEKRGKDVAAVFSDSPADTLRFLIPEGVPYLFHDKEPGAALARLRESDLIILMDCNGFSRAEALESTLAGSHARKVLIDHHLDPETEAFDLAFSTPDISSASELLYQILMEMPDIGHDAARLPAATARALMAGMTTDTNNFANSVYPSTLRMASELLAAGVDRDTLLMELYNRYRENRVRVMGYLQHEAMRITPEGVAYIVATREILDRFDVREGETEGLVNVPLSIDAVKMSIFLKEADGCFRVSLRSKKGISAQRCAMTWFHGGGHENASGGKLCWPGDIACREEAAAYLEHVSRNFMP